MAKQVVVFDNVHQALNEIVEARKLKQPHVAVTKQSVVNELVLKAHRRECKQ